MSALKFISKEYYILQKLFVIAAVNVAMVGVQNSAAGEPEGVKYSFSTQDKPAPTVILAHGCGGVGTWDNQWTYRVKSWGYNAVVVDSFSKRGITRTCGMSPLVVHPVRVRSQDMIDTAKFVRSQPWHKGSVIVIGMSHGGATAAATGVRKDAIGVIDASVSLYPGCGHLNSIYGDPPAIPTQINLAGDDDWTPCTHWGWEKQGFNENGSQYFVYPGTTHAFDVRWPGGRVQARSSNASGVTYYWLVTDNKQTEILIKNVKAFIEQNLH
jgi:dienelactone hydrolase